MSNPPLYKERTRRITFDVPISLKIAINSTLPPSTLSSIMRTLIRALLKFFSKVGPQLALHSILNNRIEIIIIELEPEPENKNES